MAGEHVPPDRARAFPQFVNYLDHYFKPPYVRPGHTDGGIYTYASEYRRLNDAFRTIAAYGELLSYPLFGGRFTLMWFDLLCAPIVCQCLLSSILCQCSMLPACRL